MEKSFIKKKCCPEDVKKTRRFFSKRAKIKIGVAICLIVGIAIRFLYCIKYPVPVRDAFKHKTVIEEWINTGIIGEKTDVPPFSLYLLKIPSAIFSCDPIKGGTIVNLILGVLIILEIILIVKKLTLSNAISLVFGLIAATHPTLVDYSCQAIRENTYLFFCGLAVLAMLEYMEKKNIGSIILLSLNSAAAFLCRIEGTELFAIFSLAILLSKGNKMKSNLILYNCMNVFFVLLILKMIGVPIAFIKNMFNDLSHFGLFE